MMGRTFKKRYTEHRSAMRNRKTAERNPTKISKHVWSLKDRDIQPEVQWKVRAKTGIYFPGAKFCDTCINEKLFILEADMFEPKNRNSYQMHTQEKTFALQHNFAPKEKKEEKKKD